jgi:hypothetical protein
VITDDKVERADKLLDLLAVKRFNDLFMLLGTCLSTIQQFLDTHDSYLGIAELIQITNEIDVAYMLTQPDLRNTYNDMHTHHRHPHPVCFEAVSNLVLERLEEWKQPVRVEGALRMMLKVLPKPDIETLDQLGVKGFRRILNNYGMASEATELTDSVSERRAAGIETEPWRKIPSPAIHGSQHPCFYTLRSVSYVPNRIRRRRVSIERETMVVNNWSELEQYLPSVDEGNDDVFRQRPDEDSDSVDEIEIRSRNYQDAWQKLADDDAEVEEAAIPVRRSGHGDGNGTPQDFTLLADGHEVLLPVGESEEQDAPVEESEQHPNHSDGEDDVVYQHTVRIARPENRHDGNGTLQAPILLADDNEMLFSAEENEEHNVPIEGTREPTPAPAHHPHPLPPNHLSKPSFKPIQTARSAAWEFGHLFRNPAAPPIPSHPTTSRDHYNEYMALPQDLELEHCSLPLEIGNHYRQILLRDFATAEAEHELLGAEPDLHGERGRVLRADVEADLWTIRIAVGSARIFGGRGKTLRQLIDLEEGDAGFGDVVGA